VKQASKHILIPLSSTALFFVVALTPVEVIGCRNRGLIAAFIAISAGITRIVASIIAIKERVRGHKDSFLWIASSLIFAIPALYIVVFAH
jgi:hypothetical protein